MKKTIHVCDRCGLESPKPLRHITMRFVNDGVHRADYMSADLCMGCLIEHNTRIKRAYARFMEGGQK